MASRSIIMMHAYFGPCMAIEIISLHLCENNASSHIPRQANSVGYSKNMTWKRESELENISPLFVTQGSLLRLAGSCYWEFSQRKRKTLPSRFSPPVLLLGSVLQCFLPRNFDMLRGIRSGKKNLQEPVFILKVSLAQQCPVPFFGTMLVASVPGMVV